MEEGKFHPAFIDDRLALPSRYGGSFTESVRHGVRVVKLDLIPVLTAMALTTEHLGLGATYSTTYYHPFHIARVFATLDHLTAGRIGWNVVTSLNDTEAQNFGMETVPSMTFATNRQSSISPITTGSLLTTWQRPSTIYVGITSPNA